MRAPAASSTPTISSARGPLGSGVAKAFIRWLEPEREPFLEALQREGVPLDAKPDLERHGWLPGAAPVSIKVGWTHWRAAIAKRQSTWRFVIVTRQTAKAE